MVVSKKKQRLGYEKKQCMKKCVEMCKEYQVQKRGYYAISVTS